MDEPLSPGQRSLLEALRRLDEFATAGAEPAVGFHVPRWVAPSAGGIDLESAAGLAAPPRTARVQGGADPPGATSGGAAPAPGSAGPAAGTGPLRGTAASELEAPASPDADGLPDPPPGVAELASLVNRRELDPHDLVDRLTRRIEALDPSINAVVTRCAERAHAEADRVLEVLEAGERPRPLAGVPIVHKDIFCTRGVATAAGSRLLSGWVPDEDAGLVVRLANAGTLTLGKSNTHEFATGTTGTVSSFGPTRNPWDLERMAGGSSSGSAAALSAGLVAAATGSDTGGSIRIPAACCGVVGLKPTYGRVGRTGVVPFAWSLDHVGPMGRRVADVAALLTAMAGHDPLDPGSADVPAADFRAGLDGRLDGVRFAVPERFFLEAARAEIAAAVGAAGDQLAALGAEPVDLELPDELSMAGPVAIAIFLTEAGAVHRRLLRRRPDAYQKETRALLGLAEHVEAAAYVHAQRLRRRLMAALAPALRAVDVLITPTLPITAPRIDDSEVPGADGPIDVRAAMTLFTRPFNLTGLPALSLPCGFDADGLPIGLQIVGRPFEEGTVLRVADAYESATDWHRRRPPGFGGTAR